MSETPLQESATAVANASGVATARLQPSRAMEQWHVTGVALTNSSTTNDPVVQLYRGAISPSNQIGGSYSGRQTGGSGDDWFQAGQALIAQWTGCDVGSTSYINITGKAYR